MKKIASGIVLVCAVVVLALLPISVPSGGVALAQVSNPVIIIVASTPTSCSTLPLKIVTGTANLYGTNGSGGCTQISGGGGSGIAKIQISVGTTQIPANSCLPTNTTYNTATMTGLGTTNTITFTPAGDLSSVTGWTPATPGLYFNPKLVANTLNWQICNGSSSPITPGSSTTWNVSAQ